MSKKAFAKISEGLNEALEMAKAQAKDAEISALAATLEHVNGMQEIAILAVNQLSGERKRLNAENDFLRGEITRLRTAMLGARQSMRDALDIPSNQGDGSVSPPCDVEAP